MTRPYYTAGSESSYHISQSAYCASDLVFQTAAVVLNHKAHVMLVEDPVTGIIGLPRSHVPHSLDDLLAAPLAFLDETGLNVDPLPLCMPIRRYKDPDAARYDPRPDLAFTEHVATTPFAIALDLAYLPFSNLPRFSDGRQSIVLWYAGFVNRRIPTCAPPPSQQRLVQFLPIQDAVYMIDNRPLQDSIGVWALRLFEKLWAATKCLPIEVQAALSNKQVCRRAPFMRHEDDIECYPVGMMEDPMFPVATPNSTEIVNNAFWAASDFFIQTEAILFDKERDVILLKSDRTTIPRCDGNDVGALLQSPLSGVLETCTRLPLPRLTKKYRFVDGSEVPEAETRAEFKKTTGPFFVTFRTHWDLHLKTVATSRGRQGITFWYAGAFDASLETPADCVPVPLAQAIDGLKATDPFGWVVLSLFSELWDTVKGDDDA